MALDHQTLDDLVAEQIEAIESDLPNGRIESAVILAVVSEGDAPKEIRVRTTSSAFETLGILRSAEDGMLRSVQKVED